MQQSAKIETQNSKLEGFAAQRAPIRQHVSKPRTEPHPRPPRDLLSPLRPLGPFPESAFEFLPIPLPIGIHPPPFAPQSPSLHSLCPRRGAAGSYRGGFIRWSHPRNPWLKNLRSTPNLRIKTSARPASSPSAAQTPSLHSLCPRRGAAGSYCGGFIRRSHPRNPWLKNLLSTPGRGIENGTRMRADSPFVFA
jgi:hypothetical protein